MGTGTWKFSTLRQRTQVEAVDARLLLRLIIVAAAYVAFAKIGFELAFATKQVTAVWPPTGIAVAALLLWGDRVWPGIWLGAFIGNAISDEPLLTAAGIAMGNTFGPLFAALLLRKLADFDNTLARVRDVLALTALGAATAMCVTATNGVVNLAAAGLISWSAAPPCGGYGGSATRWAFCSSHLYFSPGRPTTA
jgi:integral membrane sensor domain MASE1